MKQNKEELLVVTKEQARTKKRRTRMIKMRNGKPVACISITAKPVPVIELHEDDMQCVIKCPYCDQRTTVGETIMISGYVGCPNCYFAPSGLRDNVLWYQEHNYEEYTNGNFYKRGYIENRDGRVLKRERRNDVEEKILGKINFAEFGTIKDYPFLIGLQLGFSMNGSGVMDGGIFVVNISSACDWLKEERAKAIVDQIEKTNQILNDANVNFVSELINTPVEITLEDNRFKDLRILTEVL